ncbi:MAG: hypothetical protein U1E50_15260 [Caulobacteraceae bacterium]
MRARLFALLATAAIAAPAAAFAAPGGDLIIDARLRYEFVDQADFAQSATALTLRTRAGYETPAWEGFKALVEAEAVAPFVDDYNSSTNGLTTFPSVPDPRGVEINRAQLSWAGQGVDVTVGRQRIILGNARFVGNAGFRQNEQTFDAARLTWKPSPNFTATYAYIDNVRRIFGDDHPLGVLASNSHILQADAKFGTVQASAYAFLLDFRNAPTLSSATYGLRVTGAAPVATGVTLTYELEYARESDYGDNPANFSVDYQAAGLGLKRGPTQVSLGYERLGSNGSVSFQTPLATLHAFQGWADVFLTTPALGVREVNLRAATTIPTIRPQRPMRLQVGLYDFAAARGGARLGQELNFAATWPLTNHLTAELAAARFDGAQPAYPDRTKVWLTIEVKY